MAVSASVAKVCTQVQPGLTLFRFAGSGLPPRRGVWASSLNREWFALLGAGP